MFSKEEELIRNLSFYFLSTSCTNTVFRLIFQLEKKATKECYIKSTSDYLILLSSSIPLALLPQ